MPRYCTTVVNYFECSFSSVSFAQCYVIVWKKVSEMAGGGGGGGAITPLLYCRQYIMMS
jgi:hypothetical protein